jgi:hypothetical protein
MLAKSVLPGAKYRDTISRACASSTGGGVTRIPLPNGAIACALLVKVAISTRQEVIAAGMAPSGRVASKANLACSEENTIGAGSDGKIGSSVGGTEPTLAGVFSSAAGAGEEAMTHAATSNDAAMSSLPEEPRIESRSFRHTRSNVTTDDGSAGETINVL